MNRIMFFAGTVLLAAGVLPGVAMGEQKAFMWFNTPTNTTPTLVTLEITNLDHNTTAVIHAVIDPNDSAEQKRDKILADLVLTYGQNSVVPLNDGEGKPGIKLTLPRVQRGYDVQFLPGMTGESKDGVGSIRGELGEFSFIASFEPYDYNGFSAVFYAGIRTDVGGLTVQVSADELGFQTDGPTICRALFERLAPGAPQYHADVVYGDAEDHVDIFFDPQYTLLEGAVIFGTTSPSPGCSGMMVVPPAGCRGDMNCDGFIDFNDIDPFIAVLSGGACCDPTNYNCDADGNTLIAFDDIDTFVALLSSGATCP